MPRKGKSNKVQQGSGKRARKGKGIPSKLAFSLPENPVSQTFTNRPKVFALCKGYNISVETLLRFLDGNGYKELHINSLLNDDAVSLIDSVFKPDKLLVDRVRGKTTLEFIGPKESIDIRHEKLNASLEEPFRLKAMHLESNSFGQLKKKVTFRGYPALFSNFSDEEAIALCSRMSSSFARNLSRKVKDTKCDQQLIIYQLHYIANKAVAIFGSRILTFIHNLRKLNFKNQTAGEVSMYTDVIPDFPVIRLSTGANSYWLAFFAKTGKGSMSMDADIRLIATRTNEEIGTIDKNGFISGKLCKFKPQIVLLYEATKAGRFEIFSGVESGNCEICGRELTHPISMRIGMGPTCARIENLDRAIYRSMRP